jgi:hypothetical protein
MEAQGVGEGQNGVRMWGASDATFEIGNGVHAQPSCLRQALL